MPPPSCPPERHSMIMCSEAKSIVDELFASLNREILLAFLPSKASKFRLLKRYINPFLVYLGSKQNEYTLRPGNSISISRFFTFGSSSKATSCVGSPWPWCRSAKSRFVCGSAARNIGERHT